MPAKDTARARARTAGRSAGRGRGSRRAAAGGPTLPSVANHPRAGDHVRRIKAWGGLAGFGLVALLSWSAEVPVEDLLLRALAGGIVAYLVAWAAAVAIWRNLVMTELSVVRRQREQEAAERAAAAAGAPDDDPAPS